VIGVLHAYSRANAGDGLLVDLTVERLARQGVGRDELVLVALAPETFPEIPHRRPAGSAGRALDGRALRGIGHGAALLRSRRLGRGPLAECSALVAVGGGYLRTPDAVSSLGTALNHLPQLAVAARDDRPSAYLPQSIGPLRGPVGAVVRRLLGGIDRVFVRDDVSRAELDIVPGVERMPDLAVLELAERGVGPAAAGEAVVLVGRAVDGLPDAGDRLRAIAGHLPMPVLFAVQAAGDARKSDATFYDRSGLTAAGRLDDVLAGGRAGVVVSVRLHGALMAILAGVPAVHLAYDRKGPAAFQDLGLGRFCLDVQAADPHAVARLTAELTADPAPYWAALAAQRPQLLERSRDLDVALEHLLQR
jgi:polysaccharide pyruvyl transferase WcaK-like protein